ncbi:hypothetical protein HY494_02770 [Candidatus Woesearchaeota archaeon]|nr:hypothetical protein [Candidatus Woesearchaeota archaeon]
MGTIISSKMKGDGKVILELLMDYDEVLQLQGHMDNVYVFSEDITDLKTNISTRGKNSATKYFLIPRELRKNIQFDKELNCQKIELKDKVIFIYTVERF